MKKSLCAVFVLVVILAFAALAQSQDIFDALRKGDVQTVKALIEKSPQLVEARDGDGNTPLHYAAHGQDAGLVNFLIDKGAKIDLAGAQVKTPLHIAAIYDRREVVDALLKRGAALETRDDYARTALILCARERGQAATGRVLIEAGADVNAVDKFGSTALELAAWRGKTDFVDLLLEKGARVPESGPRWQGMLSQAASNGLANLFRRLIDKSQDLKAVDASGVWLLHSAAAGGSAEITGLLLDKGFDPGKRDRFGWTPLHYAARDGRTDAARSLIEKGAPLDMRTIMGQTAYNVAQERRMQAVATLLAEKGADKSEIRFPVLKGDYLGQTPPGDKAELFGLGIISSIWGIHSTAVFSPDGNEVYWAPMMSFPGEIYTRGGLLMMKRVDGRWTPPAWASFSGPDVNDDVPFFSPDGKRVYFLSSRPLPGETQTGSEKIWYADRTPAGWSEAQPLDPIVNSMSMHWEFSLDRERNVYFAAQATDSLGLQDIYLARFSRGKYEKPVNAGKPINSATGENAPFIAPDGSYLIFERQYDLWVSFRAEGGAWSEPIKLGPEVNSPSVEICPIVTADGRYLFFLSQRDGESHAYWVRADVIDHVRPGSETAALALESLIAARGWEAAVAEYRKTIAGNERYSVVENELNALGYRYLRSGRTAEAVAVFEINAEAFPGSWNVWDSLAEAHFVRDDQDKAEEFYKKSVELNPNNQNGRTQLSIIQGNRLELAGETKEILRFEAGARTGLQGPYLGQKPPGSQPEIFAPGIVSSAKAIEFGVTFNPDGREMYFTRRADGGRNTIMVSRWEKDGWTAPEEAAFNMGFPSNEPYITPDGRKLYFGCNRTSPGADRAEYAIWVVERTASGAWGEPRYHGPGMFVSATRNGDLYMTDVTGIVGRDRPVVVYPWTGDGYGAPQRLGGGVNSPVVADHAHIAPDESYVLFDSPVRPGGQGGYGDLYICFHNPDGSWGEALNLGDDVNTPATNFGPTVTPDGKYIFYCTLRDIYWVSTEVIDELQPKEKNERTGS
jgi:ankyrin repeat protein/Tol biopolymer transport system component